MSHETDAEEMTVTLFTTGNEYVDVSCFAHTLGEAEIQAAALTNGDRAGQTDRLFGALVVRIVRNEHAGRLPPHRHVGD